MRGGNSSATVSLQPEKKARDGDLRLRDPWHRTAPLARYAAILLFTTTSIGRELPLVQKGAGAGRRELIDNKYLKDPSVVLYVPQAVVEELAESPSASQEERLAGYPGGAKIVRTPNGDLSDVSQEAVNTVSGPFDRNDMCIIEAAREKGLPLLTAADRMPNQVYSVPERRKVWGGVTIKLAYRGDHSARQHDERGTRHCHATVT